MTSQWLLKLLEAIEIHGTPEKFKFRSKELNLHVVIMWNFKK